MTTAAPPQTVWVIKHEYNNGEDLYLYPSRTDAWRKAAALVLENLDELGQYDVEQAGEVYRLISQGDYQDAVTNFNGWINEGDYTMEILVWEHKTDQPVGDRWNELFAQAGDTLADRVEAEAVHLAELATQVEAAQPKVWVFTNVHHGFLSCVHACTTEQMAQRIGVEHFIRDDEISVGEWTRRPSGDWGADWAWVQEALKEQNIEDEQAVILELEANT
jgi:hypothetical protein